MNFMTLEEFLAFEAEPGIKGREGSPFFMARYGFGWLAYYKVAKFSFEKYGEKGPPIGSEIITLRIGFGGSAGSERIFQGLYDDDPRFFVLMGSDSSISLSNVKCWFRDFAVITDFDYKALRKAGLL